MTDKRPVNLDIGTIDLPLPALASITHRITGVILVAASAVLLWLLDESLASPEGFAGVAALHDSLLCKLLVWGVLGALIYHSVAGIKHLIMDLGYGETLEGGQLGARLVFIVSALLILIAGVLIW